jgi:hypothetical protein
MNDHVYLSLSMEARGILTGLEILMDKGPIEGNLTHLSIWLGLDRKECRLKPHLTRLLDAGYIVGTVEDRGKQGLWYTLDLPEKHPEREPEKPKKSSGKAREKGEKAERKPKEKPQNAERTPPEKGEDKSSNDAGFGDSSLNKIYPSDIEILPSEGENRSSLQEEKEMRARVAPPALPESASDLEELEAWWAAKKGRNPPLPSQEIADMRTAMALPGMTVPHIKAFIERRMAARAAKGQDPPSTFGYFLFGLQDEATRAKLLAEPVPTTPAPSASTEPPPPKKARITSQAHYLAILDDGLDLSDYENPDEFRPREEVAS